MPPSTVACIALLALLPLANAGVLLAIRQNSAGNSNVVSLSLPSGDIRTVSPLTWQYRTPLVQATYDSIRARFLVTTFIGANTTLFGVSQRLPSHELLPTAGQGFPQRAQPVADDNGRVLRSAARQ